MNTAVSDIVLEVPASEPCLPVVVAAAESAAQTRGLGKDKALRLGLAAEEFFLYLCQAAAPDQAIRVVAGGGRYFARLAFTFRATDIDLSALNFTAVIAPGEFGEAGHGLLIASHTTDRVRLEHKKPDLFTLTCEVDKSYPEGPKTASSYAFAPPLSASPADPGVLVQAAAMAVARYPARLCPKAFVYPGRFLDMLADGYYAARAVLDSAGRPAGLICWHPQGERSVAFCGPYVFTETGREEVAVMLTEAFIEAVARSHAVCALSERATGDVPGQYFDLLGSLSYSENGAASVQPAYFRHLAEDEGAAVFAHADIENFLLDNYDRLAFVRDLLPAGDSGETLAERSVLSTAIDRGKGLAVLRPLIPGRDMAENLACHAAALSAKGLSCILLHMDLSVSWQAAMAPDLAKAGFVPAYILPNAGVSDLLVFQYARAC